MSDLFKNGVVLRHPSIKVGAGLCILLGITNRADDALVASCALTAVIVLASFFSSIFLKNVSSVIRRTAVLLFTGGFSTVCLIAVSAFFPQSFLRIELYLALIAVDTLIITSTTNAVKTPNAFRAAFEGLLLGCGFIILALIAAIIREYLGSNTFFGRSISSHDGLVPLFNSIPGAFLTAAILVLMVRCADIISKKGRAQ